MTFGLMGLFRKRIPPKLFEDIISSLVYTPGVESDIQIFTDMCPALSSLGESPVRFRPTIPKLRRFGYLPITHHHSGADPSHSTEILRR